MLEIPIYLLVLGAMGLVAVFGYVYAQRHLNVMEAVFLMAGPRTTMMEYRAVTGVWPTSNSQTGFPDAMFRTGDRDLYRVNAVQIREAGAVDFGFSRGALKGKVLTIRAWERPGTHGSSRAVTCAPRWTCSRRSRARCASTRPSATT